MPQHAYMYGAPQAPTRHYSVHGTGSAHLDKDWTKISDLAERRRIQNRIAQRNYRKRLKRGLEDLERWAGSSDADETGKKPQATNFKKTKRQSISKTQKSFPSPVAPPVKKVAVSHGQFTPPKENNEVIVFASVFESRERSHTLPMFSYPTYTLPDELLMDRYASAQPYPSMSTADPCPNHLTTTAMPAIPQAMANFNDPLESREGTLNPYLNYFFVPDVDMNMNMHNH